MNLKLCDQLIFECDARISGAVTALSPDSDTSCGAGQQIADAVEQLKLLDHSLHRPEFKFDLSDTEFSGFSLNALSGAVEAESRYEIAFAGLTSFIDGKLGPEEILRFSWRLPLEESEIHTNPELVACTISRLTYLWASVFAFMAPREWIGGTRLEKLLQLHERLRLEKLPNPSPYRYNIGHRMHQIQNSRLLTGTVFSPGM
jgi:hypothetical protein